MSTQLVELQVTQQTVLVPSDTPFEIKRTPSMIIQGPQLKENTPRRSQSPIITSNLPELTFTSCKPPRLYHLDFDLILTTATEPDLLDYQEKITAFFQHNLTLAIPNLGSLNLTERKPMGSLRRVNHSNLRQSAGRCRIEDCPIFGSPIQQGKLIKHRTFQFPGTGHPQRTY